MSSSFSRFRDIQDLRAALLGAWEASHTLEPMAGASSESVKKRRAKLYALVGKLEHRLASLWREDVKAKAESAADELAEIEYAAFLGLLARYGENVVAHTKPLKTLVRALKSV